MSSFFKGLSIAVIWSEPTHLVSGQSVAHTLNSDFTAIKCAARGDFDASYLINFDVIIASCGGRLLNRLINALDEPHILDDRPLIISVFPGIVSDHQIEAFLTRIRADFVCVNSRKDQDRYKALCQTLGLKDNSILSGPPWTVGFHPTLPAGFENLGKSTAIFAAQDLIPAEDEKWRLKIALEEISDKHPSHQIIIKPHPKGSHRVYTDVDRPKNLVEPAGWDKVENLESENFSGLLTVSSSIAFSALSQNYAAYILDIGLGPGSYIDIFEGSGLVLKAEEVDLSKPPQVDRNWAYENIKGFDPKAIRRSVSQYVTNESPKIRSMPPKWRWNLLASKLFMRNTQAKALIKSSIRLLRSEG